jgi:hypothetical protein
MERQLKKAVAIQYVPPVVECQLHERMQFQEVICHFPKDLLEA